MTPDSEPGKPRTLFVVDISGWQKGITPDITKQWVGAGINHGIVKMGGAENGIYESSTHRVQVTALRAAGVAVSRYWFNGRDGSIADQVWAAKAQLTTTPLAEGERFFWDVDQKRYLDFNSMTMCVNIGHGDERVIKAMQEQVAELPYAAALLAADGRYAELYRTQFEEPVPGQESEPEPDPEPVA